jgi:hypothetical protein
MFRKLIVFIAAENSKFLKFNMMIMSPAIVILFIVRCVAHFSVLFAVQQR